MNSSPEARSRSTADVVVTVLLVLLHALLCPVIGFLSALSGLMTDPCAADLGCDFALVDTAIGIGLVAPSVLLVAVLVVLVIRFRQRRLGWWVALLGIVVSVLVFVAVVLAVDAAVPDPGGSLF